MTSRAPTTSVQAPAPLRVLLVEDHEPDAERVRAYFEDAGASFDVTHARTLREAHAACTAEPFEAILLDLTLPDSSGIATFDEVRSWDRDGAVIVLSGLDDEELAIATVRGGAQDYVVKDHASGPLLAKIVRYAVERHQAEQSVASRERRWHAMVAHSSDKVALVDRDLTVMYASDSTERLTGYRPEELVGTPAWYIIHPDDRDLVREAFSRAVDGDVPATATYRYRSKDGDWRWFESVARNLLDDPAVEAVVINSRDVTDRVEAEREASRQRRILAAAIESLPGIFYLADHAPRLRLWNRNLERRTGRDAAELTELDPIELVEERDEIRRAVRSAFRDGSADIEAHLRTATGLVPHWFTAQRFDLDGQPHLVGMALDVSERRRAESQRAFQASLLAQVRNAVIATDAEGRVTYLNRYAEELYGWPEADALGKPITEITVPAGSVEQAAGIMAEVLETGRWEGEFDVVRRDGTSFPSWTTLTRTTGPDGAAGFLGISFDISDVKRAERRNRALADELTQQVAHLKALHAIGDAIIDSGSLDHTLDVILAQARRDLDIDAAGILMFHAATQTLDYARGAGFRTDVASGKSLRLGEGVGGQAALARRVIEFPDVRRAGVQFEPPELVEAEGVVAYVCVPLLSNGKLQGALSLFHRSPKTFDEAWRERCKGIARQAAIAIDNAYLLENLQRSNAELQLSYDRTIEGWARALDLRDEETAGHSKRVTEMTVALAKKLGIAGEALAHLRRGALLHDIGKMGVPDSILLKPGTLDPAEWEVMKKHTIYARDFLAGIPFLEPALAIPYSHHEKWDGTGYPQGLRGEQIPLAARIFAVVDVYDALTNDRPYRAAWSRERALAHVQDQAGRHFDPQIVEAFVELVEA